MTRQPEVSKVGVPNQIINKMHCVWFFSINSTSPFIGDKEKELDKKNK